MIYIVIGSWIVFVTLIALAMITNVRNKHGIIADEIDIFTLFAQRKENSLKKNDINMSVNTYLVILVISPFIMFSMVFFLSKNIFIAIIAALIVLLVPDAIVTFLKNKSNKDFEIRYARSLEQLAASLKAGMTIIQAVQEVANNKFIHESIRKRYQKLNSDLQMGISVTDAFKNFAESTNSPDAKDIAIAIDVQNEVGGHEADVIMSIASDINSRLMLRKEIKSIFSGTTSMIYIMDIIPVLIMLFLSITDKTYTEYYFISSKNMIIFVFLAGCCLFGSIFNHRKLKKVMKGV